MSRKLGIVFAIVLMNVLAGAMVLRGQDTPPSEPTRETFTSAATFSSRGGAPFEFGGIGTLNLTVDRVRRQHFRDPARNAVLQPPIRGVVLQNLRTGPELTRALAALALRSGLCSILGLNLPTNAPPATAPR